MTTPHPLFSNLFIICSFQPVAGVINKDCTEAECILPSVSVSAGTLSCEAVKVLEILSSPQPPPNSHPALPPRTPPSQLGPGMNEYP